jgi:hypothetical protein
VQTSTRWLSSHPAIESTIIDYHCPPVLSLTPKPCCFGETLQESTQHLTSMKLVGF